MVNANERIRLETSAASWNARAVLLQGLDESTAARKARIGAEAASSGRRRRALAQDEFNV